MSTTTRTLILVLGGAAALAAIGTIIFVATSEPDRFTLTGSLTITDPNGATLDLTPDGAWTCRGDGGYSDIQPGAQVTVSDASGTVLAVGELGQGGDTVEPCVMPITVPGVPHGEDFYRVEVAGRGGITVDKIDAQAGLVDLTVG